MGVLDSGRRHTYRCPERPATMPQRSTHVTVEGDRWLVNGRPTHGGREYRGWKIEGLLLNSRMVQAVFDDENPVTRPLWAYPDTGEWDADRNTRECVAAMAQWRASGLTGITVNLQGGSPLGYYREEAFRQHISKLGIDAPDAHIWAGVPGPSSQPWHNSAFDHRGDLKESYLARLTAVLDEADRLGMVVILGLYYQGQDERIEDEPAVRRGVDSACRWVVEQGYTNVVIEINNECSVPNYEHDILRPDRVPELIERAKAFRSPAGGQMLAGTSYGGGRVPDSDVVEASDFVLIHGNGVTDPERIAAMVDETRSLPGYRPMPVLFNEDDHFAFEKPSNNFTLALSRYAGWGFFDPGEGAGGHAAFGDYVGGYQNPPVNWGINTPRKQGFFDLLQQVTGA